jgi:hypothetical protein
MTTNQLSKCLIAEFGAGGASANAYEKYLHLRHGTLPRTLERVTPPGSRTIRYCPYAVAAWFNRKRVIGDLS